jgi:PAS domain S-box-containing protein
MNGEVLTTENVDLSHCDLEQVQFCGAIQPHGCMLVVEEPSLRIVQMSKNCAELLGAPLDALREGTLETALAGCAAAVIERLQSETLENGPTHLARFSGDDLPSGRALNLFGHRCGGAIILEFEILAESGERLALDAYYGMRSTVARLHDAKSRQAFFDLAMAEVRRLTGFERVMAYKFLEDGSGHVVAESTAAGLPSYLDYHFPASDIPQPARRLFTLAGLRHLPNVDYQPVALVPATMAVFGDDPVDLSRSLLRSVSPMYVDYLRNWGVKATLVMPLMREGTLWGLISCNNESAPRHAPYETRMAVEFLAQMIALMMGAIEEAESLTDRLRMKAVLEGMLRSMHGTMDLHASLGGEGPANIAAYIDACGAALVTEGRITRLGETPSDADIGEIVAHLATSPAPVIAIDCLYEHHPRAEHYAGTAAGVLAVRLSQQRPDYVLWFRPEQEKTVCWAGDPNKPVEIDESGGAPRVMPRRSFALWKESVKNRARPWAKFEIKAAADLRWALVDVILERAQATERAEQEARASKSTMEAALTAMTDAVFLCDADEQLVHFNEAFATFHRFGSAARCANKLAEFRALFDLFTSDGVLVPPDQWPVSRALRGETGVDAEYELRRKDSNEKWLGSYGFAPIRDSDGVILAAVVIARDITARKQAEAELSNHRQRLKAIIDASMEGIISIDSDDAIQAANPAALEMFGYRLDELTGRNVTLLIPPSDSAQWSCDKSMIGGRRKINGLRKNGEIFPQELTVTEASLGQEKLFIAFVRDLSAIEAERRHVDDLRDELARVGRMNDMAEVVAALAHEIGQPLAAICNYGAVGRRLLGPEHSPTFGDIIAKIETQAKRGAKILSRLRGFIQKRESERSPESLGKLIADSMNMAALGFGVRPPSVALDLLDANITVDVDGVLIQQVLVNFLHNAADAAACEPMPEITIASAIERPGFVRVSVSDNGPGVAPEVEDQIFAPFVTTKKYGLGVGLSLCKSIIESHQGETGFAANSPHGAVFYFTLPFAEGSEAMVAKGTSTRMQPV